jgi:short-subunit dehydrogenase
MDVNYWSVVRMTKAFLPQLLATKGGVVNISSLFGMIGVPGQAHYCSSKFAVRGFSEALAAELEEEGVHVTSVHPGGVATNIARSAELDSLPPHVASRAELDARFDEVARTTPEKAAAIILAGAARGRRRVMVGADAKVLSFIQRLFPSSYPKFMKLLIGRAEL